MVVIASNQFSGTNAILYYAKQLFNKITNNDGSMSQLLIIVLSVIQVFGTVVSTRVVDRAGRKKMILYGQLFILLCLLLIFIIDELIGSRWGTSFNSIGIITLIFMHLFAMNLTLGPCCIIYCTEVVEDITWMIITLKGLALSIALTSEYMIEYIGIGFMFFIFFWLTLLAHVFLRFNIKETKGKTTEQVYASFGKANSRDSREGEENYESLISSAEKMDEAAVV